MEEISVKKEIYSMSDLIRRLDTMDEKLKNAIFDIFKISDLYEMMKNEEFYEKYMAYIDEELLLQQTVKEALETLHLLCSERLYEETPAGMMDNMLKTYCGFDHNSKNIFRRRFYEHVDLGDSLNDIKYSWNTFCESVKNASNQKHE